ncbi:uncharacterized protein BDZ99DRAFT_206959 [Mytilinidion resinicola]|uniref:Uncharacterized protein n=1 Tax=Mytilinidion resinicola TaxID=574789 RepID=A0A6A6Y094_9PEZI|nr:uncharacterized protein BDZ99DRAFT_206959 [Mytilinidion resinicola]KAF2802231.1 hypothetical protein BDZ99DRAFT_206959 [Mytilinidion resinicola]
MPRIPLLIRIHQLPRRRILKRTTKMRMPKRPQPHHRTHPAPLRRQIRMIRRQHLPTRMPRIHRLRQRCRRVMPRITHHPLVSTTHPPLSSLRLDKTYVRIATLLPAPSRSILRTASFNQPPHIPLMRILPRIQAPAADPSHVAHPPAHLPRLLRRYSTPPISTFVRSSTQNRGPAPNLASRSTSASKSARILPPSGERTVVEFVVAGHVEDV